MYSSTTLRGVLSAAAFAFATFGPGVASAQSPPDAVIDLPAGVACAGFDLRLEIRGGVQQNKLFTDKNGNPVRFISVGKGSALTLINLNNGNSLALRPNGSGSHFQFHGDGSQTLSATGHNLIVLFPNDTPAGPSTTQFVGRVLVHIAADQTWTVRQVSGTRTDICAALA